VPRRRVDSAAIRQELTTTSDGIRAHKLIRDLLRAETTDSLPILVEYATSGPLDHVSRAIEPLAVGHRSDRRCARRAGALERPL